jgi:hypothetical protein
MNVSIPLASNPNGPTAGAGKDVDRDASSVPRKSGRVIPQRPFNSPNPTTIQRFISR